jgi:hypothetical protein
MRVAFLTGSRKHGQFTTVDVPGATANLIFSNNDRGDLCGFWLDASGAVHGFVAFKR